MEMIPQACPTCGAAHYKEKPAPGELRRIRREARAGDRVGLSIPELRAVFANAGEQLSEQALYQAEAPPAGREHLPSPRVVELYAALERGELPIVLTAAA